MAKIKVIHIITDLDIGGAEMMLFKILRNFKNGKYEHLVISLMPIGRIGERIKEEGFTVYTLGLNRYNFIPVFIKLLSILRKEKPNIVHNYLFHAEIFGRIAAKRAGAPIVISSVRNEKGYYDNKLGWILRMTDRYVDIFTAVSGKVARNLIAQGIAGQDKIRVIRNALEFSKDNRKNAPLIKQNMGISGDLFLFITVANLKPKKGHVYLFDALKVLKKKDRGFILLAVGAGDEKAKKKIRRQIRNRGLEDNVRLTGEREDVRELVAASNAFILPSLYEGLPNALLEAMAAGLPVVATRVGGVPEAVRQDETGLLVEPKDSGALAHAIERIMKEPELRKRLGSNARDYVRKNFDIKDTVASTESLYEALLEKNGKN